MAGQADPSSFDGTPLNPHLVPSPAATEDREGQQQSVQPVMSGSALGTVTERQSHLGNASEPWLTASGPLALFSSSSPACQYDDPNKKWHCSYPTGTRLAGWLGLARRAKDGATVPRLASQWHLVAGRQSPVGEEPLTPRRRVLSWAGPSYHYCITLYAAVSARCHSTVRAAGRGGRGSLSCSALLDPA